MTRADIRLQDHAEHRWVEVPPCVYCDDCDVRLYTGTLPPDRAPKERATCEHTRTDGGAVGMGFYELCLDCGAQGWWDWDEPGHLNERLVWS